MITDDGFMLYADAPKNKVWRFNGCHCICEPYRNGSQVWKTEARKDLRREMSEGLLDCDTPNCDVCAEK